MIPNWRSRNSASSARRWPRFDRTKTILTNACVPRSNRPPPFSMSIKDMKQSRQWAANANAGLEAFIQQERQQLLELFPEAASDAGVIELARVDPFRAQEYAQAFQAGEGRIALAVREQQQAVQNYAENFAAIAELHDRVFLEQNPDMQTPEVQEAAAKGVIEMLKGSGYSDEDIKMGWQIGHGPLANIRSHAIQSGLLELWRSREAKRHLS